MMVTDDAANDAAAEGCRMLRQLNNGKSYEQVTNASESDGTVKPAEGLSTARRNKYGERWLVCPG
jgi:hypothetical protein